jgi:hypothetical protein
MKREFSIPLQDCGLSLYSTFCGRDDWNKHNRSVDHGSKTHKRRENNSWMNSEDFGDALSKNRKTFVLSNQDIIRLLLKRHKPLKLNALDTVFIDSKDASFKELVFTTKEGFLQARNLTKNEIVQYFVQKSLSQEEKSSPDVKSPVDVYVCT